MMMRDWGQVTKVSEIVMLKGNRQIGTMWISIYMPERERGEARRYCPAEKEEGQQVVNSL